MPSIVSDPITDEGRIAACNGLPDSANPYRDPDARANEWLYGWYDFHCDRAVEQGGIAFDRGEALATCPYSAPTHGDIYGAWIYGWESRQRIRGFEEGCAAFLAGSPVSACARKGYDQFGLHNAWILGWGTCEGAAAFDAHRPLTECPYEAAAQETLCFAWVNGWGLREGGVKLTEFRVGVYSNRAFAPRRGDSEAIRQA